MFRVAEKELVFIDLLSLWLYFKYDCIAFETMFKLFKTASTFFAWCVNVIKFCVRLCFMKLIDIAQVQTPTMKSK